MSAYNKPSQEQSIFNPTNYSTAISKLADGTFDEIIATTATFTNLLLGSDNVATSFNALQTRVDTAETNQSTLQTQQATNTSNITALQTQQATNTSNIATNTSNIATLTSQQTTNTSNIITNTSDIATNTSDIATINTTLTPISDKNDNVPRIYSLGVGSISNHFYGSYTFTNNNTNYEFATFSFNIPASTISTQKFVFETINIANYHAGNYGHFITLSYALSTANYGTKYPIRAYRHEGDSETRLIRGVPHITIRNSVGSLGLGSGTITFTIKLYVSASNHIGSEFQSQYEVATLKLFD